MITKLARHFFNFVVQLLTSRPKLQPIPIRRDDLHDDHQRSERS